MQDTELQKILAKPKQVEQEVDAMVGRRVFEDKRKVVVKPCYASDVDKVGLFIGGLVIRQSNH